jgi:MFS family permease
MVLAAMSLFGFAQMMIMSGLMALSTDLIPPVNRGKVVGFNNFIGYIVMGLGMLLGGYLYGNVLPQSPFMISLIFMVIAWLVVLFLVHEPKEPLENITSVS